VKFSNFLKYLIIILIPLNIFQPAKAVLFEIIELAQDAQAKNKIEFIKWGLKSSKDIKKLKSKEIKSLLKGKILSGTYNDNTVSEPWEECSYYKNGTVKCQPEEKSEKWKVANDQLCFIPGGCVTVYKSIGDGSPNYFFKKYGVLFARFDEIDSIEERRLEKEKRKKNLADKIELLRIENIAKEKRIADEKATKEKRIADEKATEEKRIAKEKKIAKEIRDKKLSLIPPETELEVAQQFLENIKAFIKLYPNEFDTIRIFEFILITKPIKDGNLDDNLKEDLKLFVEFTNKSNLFMKFQDEIEKDKIEIKLNKIRTEIKKRQ